jgi:hypothetical protein
MLAVEKTAFQICDFWRPGRIIYRRKKTGNSASCRLKSDAKSPTLRTMRIVTMALIIAAPFAGEAGSPRTKNAPRVRTAKVARPTVVPPKPLVIRLPDVSSPQRASVDWKRAIFGLRPSQSNAVANFAALGIQPTTFTPYDRFLDNVWPVLRKLDDGEASMLRAMRLMETGHSFSYRYTDPYRAQSPELTAANRSGDCKSKALWLCAALGDPNSLWVVGKKTRTSTENHAWVYWLSDGRWYVLDCTENSRPLLADQIPRDRYIPYYSFGKNGAFRHSATRIQVASSIPVHPGMSIFR